MARVTVEDCIEKIDNRFDLVLAAAQRSRDISTGAPPTIDRDNDKNPVVALREIADGTIAPEDLREALVTNLQKFVDVDEPEEEDMMEKLSTGSLEDKPVEETENRRPVSPYGGELPEMPGFEDVDPTMLED